MKIKFSHNYYKLHNQTKAELIDIKRIEIDKDTPHELLDYDTTYDGGRYELKNGDYVMLVFLGNLGIPFTTIRSAKGRYGDKYEYYHPYIGDMFDLVVKEEEKENKSTENDNEEYIDTGVPNRIKEDSVHHSNNGINQASILNSSSVSDTSNASGIKNIIKENNMKKTENFQFK